MFKSDIKLYYNNKYKWYKKNDIYVIGYIYYMNKLYEGIDAINLFLKIDFKKKYQDIIKDFDGCFSIVMKTKDNIILISDMLRCFPVFYGIFENTICVYDNINDFGNKTIVNNNLKEIFSCNYVTGNETIYKNIYQLEGNQIVVISNIDGHIKDEFYYNFEFNINNKPSLKELDSIYDECVKNAIKYANGRKIILPLSGGNDSRLLAYYLKQNNYNNVLCYTYGSERNNESDISQTIANYLGYKWIFVNYDDKSMQEKYYNPIIYKNMVDYCARGYAEPMLQEWEAVDFLQKNKIIDKNCVIMPGYTNDVLCGSHIYPPLFKKDEYTYEELVAFIRDYHYIRNKMSIQELEHKIAKTLRINDFENKIFTRNEVIKYEMFDFRERQVKFITNGIRIYDMNNISWVLPFWNKKVIEFWHKTSIDNRFELKFFNKFTKYKYEELMKKAPIYKGVINESLFDKIKRVLSKNGSLNLFGYFKYKDYIKYILKYRITHYNCFFAADYIKYIKKNRK